MLVRTSQLERFADQYMWDAVHGQIQEMELVRGKIYQLEQTHLAMKAK